MRTRDLRERPTRHAAIALLVLLCSVTLLGGCARSIDGEPVPLGHQSDNGGSSVDTGEYTGTDQECERLPGRTIAEVVGGGGAQAGFFGANCRWIVNTSPPTGVTLNWFEWGELSVEKDAAQAQGYETENIRIASQTAFTMRDPDRPSVCGVTSNAPEGIFTWFVEPQGAANGDACDAPIKLMELILVGGQ